MNLEAVRYLHLNGLVSGMFLSSLLMVSLFLVGFLLKRRHTTLYRTFILCIFCFICFWMYNLYFQLLLLPLEKLYSNIIFDVFKVALPIGLIIFTKLFIQMSVLSSEASYVSYRKLQPAITLLIGLCGIAALTFLFIPNHRTVIGLTELLLMYASFIGAVFCFVGMQPKTLGKLLGSILTLGCLSFAGIAYTTLMQQGGDSMLLLTLESLMIGLVILGLSFYVVIYGYQKLMTFSEHTNYDWQQLLHNIHTATENNEFFIVYQPKVNVKLNQVTGVEALLRWQHPKEGLIPPDQFIPLSEKSYLIDKICRWVITAAVKQASDFQAKGLGLSVSINFSVKNLKPAMVTYLRDAIEAQGVTPQLIVVEITETLFMQQTHAELEALTMLADMGIQLSLDDYGTGYSSLSTMNSLAIDELKIDKSFITDVVDNQDNRIIVESILYMTHRLGVTVVAEGVENTDILAHLGDLGCENMQGYGIARPMHVQELYTWLEQTPYNTTA